MTLLIVLGCFIAGAGVIAGYQFATWGDDRAPLDASYWRGYWRGYWDGHDTASEVQRRA